MRPSCQRARSSRPMCDARSAPSGCARGSSSWSPRTGTPFPSSLHIPSAPFNGAGCQPIHLAVSDTHAARVPPARLPAPPSHLPSDAMGLCQSTQSLSVQRILAANAELAQLLFDVSRSCRELPATAGGPTSVALLTCHVSLLLANTAHGALYLSPPPTPGFLLAWRACSLAVSILIFTPGPARRDI